MRTKVATSTMQALMDEARSYGLDVVAVRGDAFPEDIMLTFGDDKFPQKVAREFAKKYRGRLITIGVKLPFIRIDQRDIENPKEYLDYGTARIRLMMAEEAINKATQPRLTALNDRKDIMGLHELAAELPVDFPGTRRVYECICHLEKQ